MRNDGRRKIEFERLDGTPPARDFATWQNLVENGVLRDGFLCKKRVRAMTSYINYFRNLKTQFPSGQNSALRIPSSTFTL